MQISEACILDCYWNIKHLNWLCLKKKKKAHWVFLCAEVTKLRKNLSYRSIKILFLANNKSTYMLKSSFWVSKSFYVTLFVIHLNNANLKSLLPCRDIWWHSYNSWSCNFIFYAKLIHEFTEWLGLEWTLKDDEPGYLPLDTKLPKAWPWSSLSIGHPQHLRAACSSASPISP